MKKQFTIFLIGVFAMVNAQWSPTSMRGEKMIEEVQIKNFYSLDVDLLRTQLKDAQETGQYSTPVEISLPTLDGGFEKFAVYSYPVMVKELADQYQLGSYVGVGIDDPNKYLRFSLAPNDFQSMIIGADGDYQFIAPANQSKTVYGVHAKTGKESGSFICGSEETVTSKQQINQMYQNAKKFSNNTVSTAKSSDQKHRTLRLALSTTGEYTTYFGGTAGAMTAINATLTRVNGVFEKDFAMHLILQNYPSIIFTNASTDPYTGNLNVQLQQTLTTYVGNANYDIGHVFNAAGGNGNAGCIGCVCVDPTSSTSTKKGSAFTQSTNPQGDLFDIDYVAHEMGHQLGATHTFSHQIEGTGTNMEPGSGSTIMGYAGITSANVQQNSDPYFHVVSIVQVQQNLSQPTKTCDIETTTANSPPVISALPTYSIPKSTAFVLTANVTDPNGDPMTYTWEQYDSATSAVTSTTGNNATGALFRSLEPTASPTRYFPKLSTVLGGSLINTTDWESVSNVARETRFVITARDNNANAHQQQTQSALQIINVGNDGPFKVNTQYGYSNAPTTITWDVVNTNAAPYNVANVKIDYTTNNGTTWNVLSASTANDGSESVTFPSTLNGQTAIVRVSAINNVFYAVESVSIGPLVNCDGSAPQNIVVSNITPSGATVSWAPVSGATYVVQYREVGSTTWTTINTTNNSVDLSPLNSNTNYEVQVATVCSGVTGTYSASTTFMTTVLSYCTATATNTTYEYISNVTLANVNNSSAASSYTDYTTNSSLQVNLTEGQQYTLTVTKAWGQGGADYDAVSAWIDYDLDGVFEDTERVMSSPVSTATPVSAQFTVPTTGVITNTPLRMRVINVYAGSGNAGAILTGSCGTFSYGEIEDYNVVVQAVMSTNEIDVDNQLTIYPNPVNDVINVTKVSNKATYEIFDTAGRIVKTGTIENNKIKVAELLRGNYVLKVEDKDLMETFKFIKE